MTDRMDTTLLDTAAESLRSISSRRELRKSPVLSTTGCVTCQTHTSCALPEESTYKYIHTYIQIYTAPKIVKTNLMHFVTSDIQSINQSINQSIIKKGKGSPYSTTERRVPELIPVLGSQPAGNVSHKPGGKLPLLSARPAVTPATLKRVATIFAAW